MKKIGVVTSGRSDYGLYFPILKRIVASHNLKLLLYVTGMHLSPEFGDTVKIIENDGFPIAAKIKMLSDGDSPFAIAQSMGLAISGFARVFRDKAPDILVVLGDRFEMHCAAVAAVPFNIPIAHIHGGEITYGSFDEQFRHSITKLSHLHFASTKQYAQRIRQMGEEPWRVIVCGAPGLDNILSLSRYSKEELETEFKISFAKPVFLVTFHPVTMEYKNTRSYILNLLEALAFYNEYNIVFTSPSADCGRRVITQEIKSFVKKHNNAFFVNNFGQRGYLSMMANSTVMIGNSSSGIIEAASFKLPVVNIGTRQEGRIRAGNVIDVSYSSKNIRQGIDRALSSNFRRSLKRITNPYGYGKASERIISVLKRADFKKLLKKRFCDIE